MIKFSSKANFLEICDSARPLRLFLNRPLIKILEDLGVNTVHIEMLQREALQRITDVLTPKQASGFFKHYDIGVATANIPNLILMLDKMGVNYKDFDFLFQCHQFAMYMALKELKYKARIPVPLGYTLMGVIDETGFLEEGEIYCAVETEEELTVLEGTCVITRSPALLAGDVQFARAIAVSSTSALYALKNCVVFSQKGDRPLCNALSGGDLDGDLYQVIFDPELFPKRLGKPAEYLPISPIVLDRPCTLADMGNFFIDYMQNDRVGQLSTIHLETSDYETQGVFHPACVTLARMATTALDYGKSGIMVDMSELPRQGARPKPDFMIREPRLLALDRERLEREMDEETREEDEGPTRIYRSQKVLGRLFRAVDEESIVAGWTKEASQVQEEPVSKVWQILSARVPRSRWVKFLPRAHDIVTWYDAEIKEIMHTHAISKWGSLSEMEIYVGGVLARGRRPKNQFDINQDIRKEYEFVILALVDALDGPGKMGAAPGSRLNQAMACLFVIHTDTWKSLASILMTVILEELGY